MTQVLSGAGMWALHKGRRTVGEELSWVGPCGARNPIGVPETGIEASPWRAQVSAKRPFKKPG